MQWPLEGQDQVAAYFQSLLRQEKLPSSFLFAGPPGVGKWTAAVELARGLLCLRQSPEQLTGCRTCRSCKLVEAGTHPDLLLIELPEGKNLIPLELVAGSRERRGQEGLIHQLALRPDVGTRKVAVIDEADTLTPEAANSLLKVLEEPPPDSVLILVSHNLEQQLPTIRSRCQVVPFRPLSPEAIARLVQQLGWTDSAQEAQRVARYAGGSLRQARELLDPELWTLRSAVLDELARPRPRGFAITEQVNQALEKLKQPAQRRNRAVQILGFVLGFYHALVCRLAGAEAPADEELTGWLDRAEPDSWHPEAAQVCLHRVVHALELVQRNVQVALVLQGLWEDLARQTTHRRTPLYELETVFDRTPGVAAV